MRIVVCCLLVALSVACGSPRPSSPTGNESVGLSQEEVARLIASELGLLRTELASRFTSFEKGAKLSNRMSSLSSEVQRLESQVRNGDIPRVDGLAVSFDNLERLFRELEIRLDENYDPLRHRIAAVEERAEAEEVKNALFEEELNGAYAEVHALREELIGVLGELQAYRQAYAKVLELRKRTLDEEGQLLEQIQKNGDGEAPRHER